MHPADEIEYDHLAAADLVQPDASARTLYSVSDPIAADCRATYKAVHHSGKRALSAIKHVVIHSTEGSTAQGAASWFTNPKSGGSTHLVVDDNICYRTLDDNLIPWGARGANVSGIHIEQAGFAKWISTIWSKTHRRTLERAAYKTAHRCRLYGIPPYFVAADGLRLGKAGVTTHNECSKAFGGDHWDPGTGWPRYLFMNLVRFYYFGALRKVKKIA